MVTDHDRATTQARLAGWFRLTNLAVLPGWFLLVFAPRSRWTARFLEDDTLFMGLGAVYGAMLAQAMRDTPAGGRRCSIQPWKIFTAC